MKQKHFNLTDFSSDNWHLYVEKPDADFSPEHNYAVIQGTIDEYRKLRFGLSEKTQADTQDKADILSSFAKYKLDQGGEKKIEQFLGKKRMADIYGDKLFKQVKMLDSVNRLRKVKNI